jgi:glycosyltransferase involved in cell wall biosynthesis
MKPKVLLITTIYPPQVGGPAIFISRFKDWLTENDYDVQVITYSENIGANKNSIFFISLRANRLIAFFRFIRCILKNSDKNTLVLANGAFIETYFASLFSRFRFILKIPGDHVWEFSRNRGWTDKSIEDFQSASLNFTQYTLRKLTNISLKNADFVISPSNQLASFLKNWGIKDKKIKIIFNCVDPKQFISHTNNGVKKFDLVTVCRLVKWKGVDELIECAIRLNLKLVVVGDGPLMTELKLKAEKAPENVLLLGSLNNKQVIEILSQSKIFVLNSNFEATSYAVIEAKMAGIPILAKATDGSLTLVQDGIDGLIYSGASSSSLETAINQLTSNKTLIEKFGLEAKRDALQRFNQEINFPDILKLMECYSFD